MVRGCRILSILPFLLPLPAVPGEEAAGHPSPVAPAAVTLRDAFWAPRLEANAARGVPHVLRMCEEAGGRVSNFRRVLGRKEGVFDGIFFNDSDLYKALEGAVLSLSRHPDPALEKKVEEIIDLIAAAQRPDGYVNTYYQLKAAGRLPQGSKPDGGPFSDLIAKHELYCAGHLIEAAVAHFRATGRTKFLEVAVRLADHIASIFGPDRRHGVPGHPELELALVRLWEATGQKKHLELAKFFLEERGRHCGREIYGEYCQDLEPLVEQSEPVGHVVRAGYLFAAAADVARIEGRQDLAQAVDRLWRSVVDRKMYVTGSAGHSAYNEGFGPDYDLSNEHAYNETCAAIALALWAHRMWLLRPDGAVADVLERILYNAYLSGVSLDGTRTFYVNPMTSDGGIERSLWQGCACCPTNVVRALPSVPGFFYAVRGDDEVWVNLFASGSADIPLGPGGPVRLTQETRYPWEGKVRIQVDVAAPRTFTLRVRLPGWCANPSVSVNGGSVEGAGAVRSGYLPLRREWRAGDAVELDLPLEIRRLRANPGVWANRGRVALARGPLIYCIEGEDSSAPVARITLPADAELRAERADSLLGGVVVLRGRGLDASGGSSVEVSAIPYYAWANRGGRAMRVWIPEAPETLRAPPDRGRMAGAKVTASHCWKGDRPAALVDGILPRNGGEAQAIPRLTWWDRKGTEEWVACEFPQPFRIWRSDVLWFVDAPKGGGCDLPESMQLEYLDGAAWRPVRLLHAYARAADYMADHHFTIVRFEPVEARAVRLRVRLREGRSAGILEWRLPE